MAFTMGMYILIAGALFAILGFLLLCNHGKIATIIFGMLFLIAGLCGVKFGYDLDQSTESQYTVTDITAVTARDSNNNYRVTLKNSSGVETWIYVNDDNLFRFPKDEVITIKKKDIKKYSNR
ncbi:MAG: hypothetical protein K2K06_05360 [Oscillospiraceae bacterium]|nr:hypothetical protein [Ruminococcus sp.]MDE6707445.1 hypothetical protein [Oscillospiraceae bacterium]